MKAAEEKLLPLFPLPDVVLFPSGLLPLHIFEPRYREMVGLILETDRTFGVLRFDEQSREPANIGCSAEIVSVKKLADGRMNILTMGKRRFKVLEYIYDKDYLQGRVEWLEDKSSAEDLTILRLEVETLLKDVVRLSAKLADKEVEFPQDLPKSAQELSFWVAGSLFGLAKEQQDLLELEDTARRLSRESELLATIRKELVARAAINDAFSSDS